MTALRVTPLILSCLLMAAHFLRSGGLLIPLLILLLPLLLLGRSRWAVWLMQGMLALFALEWVRTALTLAAIKNEAGLPTERMLVILLSVAAFTALSALPLGRLAVARVPPVREPVQ